MNFTCNEPEDHKQQKEERKVNTVDHRTKPLNHSIKQINPYQAQTEGEKKE